MHEGRKEFGLRRQEQPAKKELVPENRDFERDLPMYVRLRTHDAEMDKLLSLYESMSSAQESRFGVHADVRDKEELQRQIRARYEEISG